MTKILIKSLLCLAILLIETQQFYSRYYRKCKLKSKGVDLGALEIQRSPDFHSTFKIPQPINTRTPLQYTELDFIYDSFIGAGGSGQVYLVEDEKTGKHRVLKRFFKEKVEQFETENYIMRQMNYSIGWHHEQNMEKGHTIASYEYKNSVPLSDMQLTSEEYDMVPVIIYKMCKEVLKSLKKGILHHDIKMGNFLVNSVGEELRMTEVQLIDWNLAMFYYQGFQSNMKQGTICYYSPEQKLRNHYVTPSSDMFALSVVIFSFLTGKKPYPFNCKDDDFQALLSLLGSQRFLKFLKKYRSYNVIDIGYIQKQFENPDNFGGISLRDRIPENLQKVFDDELVDLLQKMMEPDPEYRLTIEQVLHHPYFDRVKKLPEVGKKKKEKENKKGTILESPKAPANNLISLPEFNQDYSKIIV